MKKQKTKKCIKVQIFLAAFLFLFLTNTGAQESLFKLKVVTEQANIRLKPDIGSIIIQQIQQGTVLESLGKEGEWYLVKLEPEEGKQVSGYVHESLVIEIERIPQEIEIKEPPPSPPITPPSFKPTLPQLDLFISGGGNFFKGGDLNRGSQGLADFYRDTLGIQGKGEIKPVHLSYILGGELNFPLSSRLFLGLGADYFQGEKKSSIEFQRGSSSEIFTARPKIQALPLRLVLSFYILPNFYTKNGVEYYFARCTYSYRFQKEDFSQEWRGEADAQGFGFLGGFGFVHDLTSHISIIVEATGRYAKLKGFKGKDNYTESTGLTSTEEGILYIYQGQISEQKSYPLLFIREKKPTEAGVIDPKEATIDFSGVAIKAGIKIRF